MPQEETASNLFSVITWLEVLLGWVVVHFATLNRERRKERRELADSVVTEIKAIEQLSIEFHSSNSFNSQSGDDLVSRVNRVIRKLQREPLASLDIPLGLMVRFRKGHTLQNMDSSSFTAQAFHGEIIRNIRSVTDDLIESVEAAKNAVFK